jgi:hypothetical protein
MRPRETSYRLAQGPKEYQQCHAFLRAHGFEESRLSWPTVMAIRQGEVVGCLSRIPSEEAIIAGPLAVSTKHPLLTAMRLITAWQGVLWRAAVQKGLPSMTYYFGVDPTQHNEWLRLIDKVGLEPYARDAQAVWFKRELRVTGGEAWAGQK